MHLNQQLCSDLWVVILTLHLFLLTSKKGLHISLVNLGLNSGPTLIYFIVTYYYWWHSGAGISPVSLTAWRFWVWVHSGPLCFHGVLVSAQFLPRFFSGSPPPGFLSGGWTRPPEAELDERKKMNWWQSKQMFFWLNISSYLFCVIPENWHPIWKMCTETCFIL